MLSKTRHRKLILIKLLLFDGILLASGAHVLLIGKQAIDEMMKGSDRMKKIASWSGRIMLLLALAAAYVGVILSRGGF